MSGIEVERIINFEILELIKDSITCKKCFLICNYPLYCPSCEISYCKGCINNSAKCESCSKEDLKDFPNIFKNFYSLIQIKCKNKHCNKVFLYEDLDKHQKECNNNVNFILINKDNNSNLLEESVNFEKSCLGNIHKNCTSIHSFAEINDNNNHSKDQGYCIDVNEDNKEESEKNISFSFVTNNDFSYIQSANGNEIDLENRESNIIDSKVQQESNNLRVIETLVSKVNILESTVTNLTNELRDIKEILLRYSILNVSQLTNEKEFCYHNKFFCSVSDCKQQSNKNPNEGENKILLDYRNSNIINKISIPKNILKPNLNNNSFKKCESCKSLSISDTNKNCSFCSKNICISCYSFCLKCNKISCTTCSKCSICKTNKLCLDCKRSCSQCQKNSNAFCSECIKICEKCGKDFCKICCGFVCKDSNCRAILCINCCWNCKVCYNTHCEQVKNIVCRFCGAKACEDKCNSLCLICEKDYCLSCIVQCSKCEKQMCKNCSVKEVKNKNLVYNCKKCL